MIGPITGAGTTSTLNLPATLVGTPNYTFNQGNGDASSRGDLVITRIADPGFTAGTTAYHVLELEGQLASVLALRDGIAHREWHASGWCYEGYAGTIPAHIDETSAVDAPTTPLTGNITAGQSSKTSTVTITIASPAVIGWASHGLAANTPVIFGNSGGTLPTGIANGSQIYFVLAAGLATNSFEVSLTPGGAAVNTSGTQSGTQSAKSPLVYTSDTAWSTTYNTNNQSWPVGSALPVNFTGLSPSNLNGVHWSVAIDTTHFWVSFAEFAVPTTISSVSGATFATTQTAPASKIYTSSDFNLQTGYEASLRRSFEQDGSYILNGRDGVYHVLAFDAPATTLTVGNLNAGGPMASVLFNSPISLGSGIVITLNTLQTGVANAGMVFAGGSGLYTSNGQDIGFAVSSNPVNTSTAITSGSATGTVSSASGISNGMSVIGPGIRPGTTVTISGTTVTLSQAAILTLAASVLTYYTPKSGILALNDGSVTMPGAVTVGSLTGGQLQVSGAGTTYLIWKDTNVGSGKEWEATMQDDGGWHLDFYNGSARIHPIVVDTSGNSFFSAVGINSGTNAKAGTFTLVSGTKTVANTSITANSVVVVTLKTASGTRTGNPDIVCTASTGFVATGAATDNGTYNYVIFEVN